MTLREIYNTFTPGSEGFAEAVVTHGGYDISLTEAQRLGNKCISPAQFESEWEDATWWTDNSAEDNGEAK